MNNTVCCETGEQEERDGIAKLPCPWFEYYERKYEPCDCCRECRRACFEDFFKPESERADVNDTLLDLRSTIVTERLVGGLVPPQEETR